MAELSRIVLAKGREKALMNRHPWIYSGAVARVIGDAVPGDMVDVVDAGGAWWARGYYNPNSKIRVRVLTWEQGQAIDRAFLRQQLAASIARRERMVSGDTNAYRLVYAESDGLPGLIVDRYADWVVLQSLTMGMDGLKQEIAEMLMEMLSPRGIYERSDADIRPQEGLGPVVGVLAGEIPPERIEVHENGLRFYVDILNGHKTGFYLDQRMSRETVGSYCAGGDVLNVFAYTGGFSVYAARAGAAHISHLDSSANALDLAAENMVLNGFEPGERLEGDAFKLLRTLRDQNKRYDVVVLDPPKFAFSKAQVQSATRGYKDINMSAMHLLKPGGILATFSCSGAVDALLFQKVVFGAGIDSGRELRVLQELRQGPDHPVFLPFPQGAYLKGLLCLVE